MDDAPSTSKRRWNEGDTEEEELSLGNTRNVKRKPRGERQSTRGGRQSPSSSAPNSSREPSIDRAFPNLPGPSTSRDAIFRRPTGIPRWPQQNVIDESERDIQLEGSQSSREGRQRGSRLTAEEKRRRAAERMRIYRQNMTPEQREEQKRRDKERKKITRALEIERRTGILPNYEEMVLSQYRGPKSK